MIGKILTPLAACLVFSGLAMAAERQFDYADFSRIDGDGQFTMRIQVGAPFSIHMEGDAQDLERMRVKRRGRTLKVDYDKKGLFSKSREVDVTVFISLPTLDRLAAGAGLSVIADEMQGDDLEIDVTTGAEVELTGQCGELELDAATGAVVKATGLDCDEVDVEASTGAIVSLYSIGEVEAGARLGAEIEIHGPPSLISRSTVLGGSVKVIR